MRFYFSMLFLAIIGGCVTTNGTVDVNDLTLHVSPDQPARGEQVTLILRNQSAAMAGYNLCTSSLMRQVPDGWQPVPSDRVCTMELRTLEPGDEASFPLQLEVDLASGTYRFETRVELLETGGSEQIATEPFAIVP